MFAGWIGWDDRGDAPRRQLVTQTLGVIGPVGNQSLRMADHPDQSPCARQVVGIARCDQKRQRPPNLIGQRMDFGRLPAARTADGVAERPPFPPAAERCALT